MRLRLQIFQESLILTVEQTVSPRSVEVLNAGYGKLYKMEVQWIFVDLSRAEVQAESARLALETRPKPAPDSAVKKIFFIGNVPGLCEFDSMEAAFSACTSKEAELLKEKTVLEREIQAMRLKKGQLEEDFAKNNGQRPQSFALIGENRQLKRILEAMVREITMTVKSGESVKARASDPATESEFETVRAEAHKVLSEAGISALEVLPTKSAGKD